MLFRRVSCVVARSLRLDIPLFLSVSETNCLQVLQLSHKHARAKIFWAPAGAAEHVIAYSRAGLNRYVIPTLDCTVFGIYTC